MKKRIIKMMALLMVIVAVVAVMVACGGDYGGDGTGSDWTGAVQDGGDNYAEIVEHPFTAVKDNPTSNISLTVNTAAYTQIKNYITNKNDIPKNAVKIEEMINYFSYDYGEAVDGDAFSMRGAVTDTPWNDETKLLTVGMKAKEVDATTQSHNLVFLVDVSGSMSGADRLGLSKKTFIKMLDILGEDDTVSIVTYAGSVATLLDGAKGSDKAAISSAINKLSAGGSTAGGSGINEAYRCAFKHQTDTNNSRIIIATDGDFNVGAGSPEALKKLISENRSRGVYMSALGFGMGNLSDTNMQEIVHSGQGTYAFIDSEDEAYSLMSKERISRVLTVAAEEAKAQIAFNPDVVSEYRMIGYENKSLSNEEWEDSSTPAGAIAGGGAVTAVYEIKLKSETGKIATVTNKYRHPREKDEQTQSMDITDTLLNPSDATADAIKSQDTQFISAIVETALVLRSSQYRGSANLQSVLDRLDTLDLSNNYRAEFRTLVQKLKDNYSPSETENGYYVYKG